MEPIIGIDLGTTNSEVAFIIDSNAEILKDNDNGIVLSCVSIDPESKKIITGSEAANQALLYPENTVRSVKRAMGSNIEFLLNNTSYSPQEISAFILKNLKERAEKVINQPISKAVITTPAYFTDAQRMATREAGEIAGLTVVRILNEPTAAALAYESDNSENQNIMIYDLGGGTFDVSIVTIQNGVVEVLASTGDNHLGGDDFDKKIEEMLVSYIQDEFDCSVADSKSVMARLRRAAEQAKIQLSSAPYANIEEDYLYKNGSEDVHLSYELQRHEFEDMIEDYLDQTMTSVNKALADASMLPADLDKIILVGGSTRIPKLSQMLEEKFKMLPSQQIDPDLCVALGAAIQAGREMGIDSTGVLVDITPYTFGISALGEINGEFSPHKFVPMIKRNSKLPTAKSDAFSTVFDQQDGAELKVYQGESDNALENVLIGEYFFKLSKLPAHSTIIIKYELDINGILKIHALEKATGKELKKVIKNAFSQFSDKSLADSKNKINALWSKTSPPDQEKKETDASASLPEELLDIIQRAESLKADASSEDQEEIDRLIKDINNAFTAKDKEKAFLLGEELEDILFYIE
ncbi:MAG: Hsp70 family protein [Thermodesulfobacteriota bacterium]|nr:Hsp70 family protein [Thermodesulfobacteriota bacterium]